MEGTTKRCLSQEVSMKKELTVLCTLSKIKLMFCGLLFSGFSRLFVNRV